MALLSAEAFHFGDGDAGHADLDKASRTSSSLNGRMMAVISFILAPCVVRQNALVTVSATVSRAVLLPYGFT
jgi:hypothetical protein